METPLCSVKGAGMWQEWYLWNKPVCCGVGRASAPEVPKLRKSQCLPLGSGNRVEIRFHSSVVAVKDPRTPKQPNSTSRSLWGSLGMFWNPAAARAEYHNRGLK